MNTVVRMTTLGIAVLTLAMITTAALADPPEHYITKFLQKPFNYMDLWPAGGNVDTYLGHDETSTAYLESPGAGPEKYSGIFMADDFADSVSRPVVHVQWWGSYVDTLDDDHGQVKQFLICFESNLPADDEVAYSRPGEVISSEIVTLADAGPAPGPGTFTERPVPWPDPDPRERVLVYNAELALPFPQKAHEIYWLKIVALVDQGDPDQEGVDWGWHNRDYTRENVLASPLVTPGEKDEGPLPNVTTPDGDDVPVWHFQDDAVTGEVDVSVTMTTDPDGNMLEMVDVTQPTLREMNYSPLSDGPDIISEFSLDLAFALYAVPEPSTSMLLVTATVGLFLFARRRR